MMPVTVRREHWDRARDMRERGTYTGGVDSPVALALQDAGRPFASVGPVAGTWPAEYIVDVGQRRGRRRQAKLPSPVNAALNAWRDDPRFVPADDLVVEVPE